MWVFRSRGPLRPHPPRRVREPTEQAKSWISGGFVRHGTRDTTTCGHGTSPSSHHRRFLVIRIAFQGATVAQARAALRRHNDVMEAAERIFGGAFDDIRDESSETSAPSAGPSGKRERWPVTTRLVVCSSTCVVVRILTRF